MTGQEITALGLEPHQPIGLELVVGGFDYAVFRGVRDGRLRYSRLGFGPVRATALDNVAEIEPQHYR